MRERSGEGHLPRAHGAQGERGRGRAVPDRPLRHVVSAIPGVRGTGPSVAPELTPAEARYLPLNSVGPGLIIRRHELCSRPREDRMARLLLTESARFSNALHASPETALGQRAGCTCYLCSGRRCTPHCALLAKSVRRVMARQARKPRCLSARPVTDTSGRQRGSPTGRCACGIGKSTGAPPWPVLSRRDSGCRIRPSRGGARERVATALPSSPQFWVIRPAVGRCPKRPASRWNPALGRTSVACTSTPTTTRRTWPGAGCTGPHHWQRHLFRHGKIRSRQRSRWSTLSPRAQPYRSAAERRCLTERHSARPCRREDAGANQAGAGAARRLRRRDHPDLYLLGPDS